MDPQEDRGAVIITTTWALTGVATQYLCLRLYCKFSRARSLWWDDFILVISWVGRFLWVPW